MPSLQERMIRYFQEENTIQLTPMPPASIHAEPFNSIAYMDYYRAMYGEPDSIRQPSRIEAIIRGKQKGKTTKLAYLANKEGALIMTTNRMRARNIIRIAESNGWNIQEPITYYSYESDPSQYRGQKLLLDDLENYILEKFSRNTVLALSLSVGEGSILREEEDA